MNNFIIECIRTCFRKFVTTAGRASRTEYWIFLAFSITVGIIAGAIDSVATRGDEIGVLSVLVVLVFFFPTMAVTVRRFHDVGLSGWYFLGILAFTIVSSHIITIQRSSGQTPYAALIWFAFFFAPFVIALLPSNFGPNQFGNVSLPVPRVQARLHPEIHQQEPSNDRLISETKAPRPGARIQMSWHMNEQQKKIIIYCLLTIAAVLPLIFLRVAYFFDYNNSFRLIAVDPDPTLGWGLLARTGILGIALGIILPIVLCTIAAVIHAAKKQD